MSKIRLIIFVLVLFVCGSAYFYLRNFIIDSREKGILLSSGTLKDSLFKNPVVVSYDGKKSTRYRYQPYVSPSENYFPNYYHENEFKDFLKVAGISGYLLESVSDDSKENFIFKFLKSVDESVVMIWSFNINDKSYREISGDYREYNGCDWLLYFDSSNNELVTSDAIDVSSVLEINKFCKISTLTGDVVETLELPFKERVELFPYFIDEETQNVVLEDPMYLLDIDSMAGKVIEVPGWESFEIVSKNIFDGKIIIANNLNIEDENEEFVVYDIKTNQSSKVIRIDFKDTQFVDISPNSKHILFKHFVRDANLRGGGNGYYCYVVVDSEKFTNIGQMCSLDQDGKPRGFIGWVE